jgi:hypothetical protein
MKRPQSEMRSAFDQPHVAGAWSLLRIFWSEVDPLALAQELEHRTPH